MFNLLIKPLADLAGVFLKGKVEKAQADAQLKLETVRAKSAVVAKVTSGEMDWNQSMADASAASWKDEWLTILVSVPLILAFTGQTQLVTEGFAALDAMPSYYQSMVGVVFAASFGVQKLTQLFKSKGIQNV